MIRRTMSFTDRQNEALKAEAQRLEITDNDVLRRVLDQWLDGPLQQPFPPMADNRPAGEDDAIYHSSKVTGGSVMVRVWTTTSDRLTELLMRHPHLKTRINLIYHLVNAADEVLDQILSNSAAPTIYRTPENKIEAIELVDDASPIDRFLHECCVKGNGLSIEREAIYYAYELWSKDEPEESPPAFAQHLARRNFIVPDTPRVVYGLALRKGRYANAANVVGYDVG